MQTCNSVFLGGVIKPDPKPSDSTPANIMYG